MKSLVVEDELFAREGMKYFLADYSEADTVSNGREAVELFSRAIDEHSPYQLVLLDILMPVMNGQAALKQMRHLETQAGIDPKQKAVIIMVTGLNSQEDMEEAFWRGDCTDYMVKPIVRADLLAMLRRHGLIK